MEVATARLATVSVWGFARRHSRRRGALLYLKLHESELVFHTALSHERTTGQLPPGAERLVLRGADGSELAGLILRPDAGRVDPPCLARP